MRLGRRRGPCAETGMFQMDIAEHVRLSHQSLEDACRAHADAAARLTRLSSWFRVATLVATAVAAVAAVGDAGGVAVGARGRVAWRLPDFQISTFPNKKGPSLSRRAFVELIPGSDLLSHAVAHAVPSAVASLTSVFGMGTGVTLLL